MVQIAVPCISACCSVLGSPTSFDRSLKLSTGTQKRTPRTPQNMSGKPWGQLTNCTRLHLAELLEALINQQPPPSVSRLGSRQRGKVLVAINATTLQRWCVSAERSWTPFKHRTHSACIFSSLVSLFKLPASSMKICCLLFLLLFAERGATCHLHLSCQDNTTPTLPVHEATHTDFWECSTR